MLRRRGFALLLLTSTFLVPACGDDPPDKEMQQAQSAIEAARVAGAERLRARRARRRRTALKNAHDAVDQRDYRLALTSAFDSRERARTAQTQAADQKIVARGEAERVLTDVSAALAQRTPASRPRRRRDRRGALAGPRRVIGDLDRTVQEARTAFARGDYVTHDEGADGRKRASGRR